MTRIPTKFVRPRLVPLILIALSTPTFTVSALSSRDVVSEQEYAVYNTVIERLYIQRRSASLIVISKETESGAQPEPGKGPVIGVSSPEEMKTALQQIADLTPAYQASNDEPAKLKNLFNLSVDYVLAGKKKALAQLAKEHGETTQFSKAYPGSETVGLVGLSRVGFNADHTQALLYAVHWCGSGCGDGAFVLLRKEDNHWNIRYQAIAYVAATGGR
jgi:hypothetical protein